MNINEVYGRLTAVALMARDRSHETWRFLCACGNELVARASDVRTGRTASCGCLRQETGRLYYTMPAVVHEFLFGTPNGRIASWEDVHGSPPSVEDQQRVLRLYRDDRETFDAMVQGRVDTALYGAKVGYEVPSTYTQESYHG